MRDFSFMPTGVLVLVFIALHFFSRPRLSIKLNRTFVYLLVSELSVMLTELAAVTLNSYYKSVAVEIVYFMNVLFFLAYLTRAFVFFVFTSDVLKLSRKRTKLTKWYFAAPLLLCATVILVNPGGSVFKIGGRGFETGFLFFIIPVCALFYSVMSAVSAVIHRTDLKRTEFYSALVSALTLMIAAVLRFQYPLSLPLNMFCLLALIIDYLAFENPDFYTSDRGNAFNKKGLRAVLEECMDNKSYRALGFVLRNYTDERGIYGGAQMDMGIYLIIEYIRKKYPEHMIFYLRNGYFVIFDSDAMNLFRIRDDLYERFKQPWKTHDVDLYLSVAFVKIGAEANMTSPDMLINTLTLAFDKLGQSSTYGKVMLDLDNTHDIEEQVRVKRALEYAVENDLVEVFLQPIVDSKTGAAVGAEALARIRDSEGKLISPAAFIPLAEKNGQINKMGEQVFEKACRFINSNAFYKTGLAFMNINLSPIQCMNSDLADRLSAIAKRYKVPSSRIHLEVTEQYMDDFSIMDEQLNKLLRMGYEFSLDDYGTGYSNLSRLKEYPFKNIKLDMSLVNNFFKERDEIVLHLITILKKFGYMVTAEGIETKEMADLMTSVGCDYLQGYYFSKPLPMDEFSKKYSK